MVRNTKYLFNIVDSLVLMHFNLESYLHYVVEVKVRTSLPRIFRETAVRIWRKENFLPNNYVKVSTHLFKLYNHFRCLFYNIMVFINQHE